MPKSECKSDCSRLLHVPSALALIPLAATLRVHLDIRMDIMMVLFSIMTTAHACTWLPAVDPLSCAESFFGHHSLKLVAVRT